MKKSLFLFLILSLFLYPDDELNYLYKEAKALEDSGDYKAAMLLYKKIANSTLNQQNIEKDDLISKNIISNPKQEFFEKNINKSSNKETNSSLEQLVTKDFGIYPYKKNYILPATYSLNSVKNRDNFETSFQLSLEKPISHNFFGLNETISFAYTQKSFWQTASSSAPFRETNYEPEVFVQIPYDNEYLKLYKASFLHSSNGKGGDISRSVNRVYLQSYFQFDNLFVSPKVWYKIPENKNDDMKDFYKYYGYGDISLLYAYKQQTFELLLRDNLRLNSSNKGAIEFNYTFPLPDFISSKNSYGIFQIFHGYGQSMIDYDKEITNFGIGIAFSR